MFEDQFGDKLYDFPCISGFPLESMHLVDGGVLKVFLEKLVRAAETASVNPDDPDSPYTCNLVGSELDDAIDCFAKFALKDQARKLRYIHITQYSKLCNMSKFYNAWLFIA